jgi:hypothetical protein
MILPLTRSLKTSIIVSTVIEYTKSIMYRHKKKSHGNDLSSRSTPARFTIRQHNIYVFTIRK